MNHNYQVRYADAIREAKLLKSEDGKNREYDRGLVELIAYLFDLDDEPTSYVYHDLGIQSQ